MSIALGPNGTRGFEFPRFARIVMRALRPLNVAFFRRFGRRMRVQGRPLLLLTTRGARTGRERFTTLGWFPDVRADSWLVVASNSGAANHPAWARNLARHPNDASIELDGTTYRVRAETLKGPERERVWRRVVELAPGYGKYEQHTDRVIPIIRLINA
jgi:deazaflavin-dependent oxidoreductase (nitroreductase family)